MQKEPSSSRFASTRLIWRWWDPFSLTGGALIALFFGIIVGGNPFKFEHWWEWRWTALLLAIAAGLGIRAQRVERAEKPGRLDVFLGIVGNWRTWLVIAILAGSHLVFGRQPRPWAPLQPCSRIDLSEKYTNYTCLIRGFGGKIVDWSTPGGEVSVRHSGSLYYDTEQEIYDGVGPSVVPYDWRWKPVTAWLLTIFAFGGLGFSWWLWHKEKRGGEGLL